MIGSTWPQLLMMRIITVYVMLSNHSIIILDLSLITWVLFRLYLIIFLLAGLEHRCASSVIIGIEWIRIVVHNRIHWVPVGLLITMNTFVSTSLFVHFLVILVIDVASMATTTRMTSLIIVFICKRVSMTSSASVVTLSKLALLASTLHLILNELFLHLVLIMNVFHFLG